MVPKGPLNAYQKRIDMEKSVVVTGATSGIGKATALSLDKAGFKVFACVRKESDGEELKRLTSDKLTPVQLDLSSENSIASAADQIRDLTGNNLFGLFNNAGVTVCGPLALSAVSDVKNLIDVNITGLLLITREIIPSMERKGRIVNMGSTMGFMAPPLLVSYSASKYALRGITRSLRLELKPLDVFVSLVEAGSIDTNLWDKAYEVEGKKILPEVYTPFMDFFQNKMFSKRGKTPEKVAEIVLRAFTDDIPRNAYRIGFGTKIKRKFVMMPVELVDWVISSSISKGAAEWQKKKKTRGL